MPLKDKKDLYPLVLNTITTFNLKQLATVLLETSIAICDRGMTPLLYPRRQQLYLKDDKGDPFASMTKTSHGILLWKTYTPETHHGNLLDSVTP